MGIKYSTAERIALLLLSLANTVVLSDPMCIRSCFDPTLQSVFHPKLIEVVHCVTENHCLHFTQGETEALRSPMICFRWLNMSVTHTAK